MAQSRLRGSDMDSIRNLRRAVRESSSHNDGRAGLIAQAIEKEYGFSFRWGHLLMLDGYVMWLYCWNELPDGAILDAAADQFQTRQPGDILVLGVDDERWTHYRAFPPRKCFEVLRPSEVTMELAVTTVLPESGETQPAKKLGAWAATSAGWREAACAVLAEMSPWPQREDVRSYLGTVLPTLSPSFRKRDIEGLLDVWTWEQWGVTPHGHEH